MHQSLPNAYSAPEVLPSKNGALPVRPSGSRLTIGFIARFLTDKNSYSTWQGVMDAALERGVNLISFFPRDLDTTNGFDGQANVLYDLVNAERVDGLIIWTAAFLSYAGPEGAKRILDRYRPLPMVALEKGTAEDIPWLGVDFYQSMREGLVHLVREHGYRRIAFIRGPDATHTGARERYQAYLDVLTEYGLPFDPNLVSPPSSGSWEQEVGEAAISLLLDQRHASFEAVVGANDYLAIGAMRALQARGIQIPGQVAVIGFDDQAESNSVIPPLTTLSLQGYEQGQRVTEMLLTLLEGGQISRQAILPPKLVVRQSCGCVNPAVAQAATGLLTVTGKARKTMSGIQREGIVSEMRQAAGNAAEGIDPSWAEQLLEAFFAELKAEAAGIFLSRLDGILRQVVAIGGQAGTWANVISALRRSALPYLENLALRRAESLWLQAQVMIGETAQQAVRFQMAQAEWRVQILNDIRTTLTITLEVEALMDTLAQELPRLGIPGCYLSLYEDQRQPNGMSRLVLAYDERRGRFESEVEKQVFPSRHLAPKGVLPLDGNDRGAPPRSFVVEALYFREEQLGFVLFEVGPRDGPIYDTLRGEISSALQGALLVQRVKERSAEVARQQYILNSFMENVPDHIYFKDLKSRFTRISEALARYFKLSQPAEAIGKSDFDIFPAEQAQVKYKQEQDIISTGQSILHLEEPDGIGHWALTTKMPLRDEYGKVIGTFGISRDITSLKQTQAALEYAYAEVEKQVVERTAQLRQEILERRQAEAEVQRLNAELEQRVIDRTAQLEAANKELEAFSYSVSHDLQAPLRAINGFSSMLIEDYEAVLPEEAQNLLTRIQHNAKRMGNLINDLLAFSRIGRKALRVEDVDMDQLVQEVLDDFRADNELKQVEVVVEALPPCQADRSLLKQVWINLISNAIKYSSKVENPRIEIRHITQHQETVYVVKDNGVGFDMQYADKLFGVFQRLHRDDEYKGTGIGLAMVRRIIERHGGSVWAEAELDKGATFYFMV